MLALIGLGALALNGLDELALNGLVWSPDVEGGVLQERRVSSLHLHLFQFRNCLFVDCGGHHCNGPLLRIRNSAVLIAEKADRCSTAGGVNTV